MYMRNDNIYVRTYILSFKLVKNGDVGTVNFYSDKRLATSNIHRCLSVTNICCSELCAYAKWPPVV